MDSQFPRPPHAYTHSLTEAILFGLDGTLADSAEEIRGQVLASGGRSVEPRTTRCVASVRCSGV